MTRISVIIPVYNGHRFLGEAIESALGQAHAPAEVIVVDDGSTDGSGDLASSFGTPVQVLTKPNGGLASARNAGIVVANGDYLAFLDADDTWPLGSLHVRLAALEAALGTDGVVGRVVQFRDNSGAQEPPVDGILAGTMLVRRSIFERTGLFDEQLRVAEFVDWYSRARDAGALFVSIDDVVLRRRLHDANMGLRAIDSGERLDYVRALRAALARKRAAGDPS